MIGAWDETVRSWGWVIDEYPSRLRTDKEGLILWFRNGVHGKYRVRLSDSTARIYFGMNGQELLFEWDISEDPYEAEGFERIMKEFAKAKGSVRQFVGVVGIPRAKLI